MKIVVLAGGLSPERNVSLSSGAMVSEALRERHRLVPYLYTMNHRGLEGGPPPGGAPVLPLERGPGGL